ncbi:MAG TPA: hypothetical protein VJT33_01335 [bacterium]|nr:hypothetical protein [bacterium]
MLQTIVIVILLIIDGAIVLTNPSVFQTALTFAAPGTANLPVVVTIRDLMIAAGGALVLAWLAALIDRAALDRRVQRYERTMRVMSDEMARVKARTYDEERQPLEDIRVKLDTLDRDIRGLRARIDREPLPRPAETTSAAVKNPSEAA